MSTPSTQRSVTPVFDPLGPRKGRGNSLDEEGKELLKGSWSTEDVSRPTRCDPPRWTLLSGWSEVRRTDRPEDGGGVNRSP